MAYTSATRADSFFTKKLLSQMVINVDECSKGAGGVVDPGNYLVGNLPEDCIVQNAYVFTTVPAGGPAAVTVGTAEAGTEILSAADAQTPGKTGTFTGEFHTGTGVEVYLTTAADTAAEYYVVIEYLELRVDTGSMTRV
jgi:hypothetical protein